MQYYYLCTSKYRLFTKSSIVPFINSICQIRTKQIIKSQWVVYLQNRGLNSKHNADEKRLTHYFPHTLPGPFITWDAILFIHKFWFPHPTSSLHCFTIRTQTWNQWTGQAAISAKDYSAPVSVLHLKTNTYLFNPKPTTKRIWPYWPKYICRGDVESDYTDKKCTRRRSTQIVARWIIHARHFYTLVAQNWGNSVLFVFVEGCVNPHRQESCPSLPPI